MARIFQRIVVAVFLLHVSLQPSAEIFRGPTQEKKYHVVVQEPGEGVRLNEVQSWTVSIYDEQGNPVKPRSLVFLAGMPDHGHGLPSSPRVTRQLSPGRYQVDGVMLNMHGDWEIVVGVIGDDGADRATVTFKFEPPREDAVGIGSWDAQELALLRSLWLGGVSESAIDESNRFDGQPEAIRLGEMLFNDRNLSRDANISCATCHVPDIAFTDGLQTSKGSRLLSRNSPTVQGLAQSQWFYWDGRRDSLWAQALTPLETPGEMDSNRAAVVAYVFSNDGYRSAMKKLNVNDMSLAGFPQSAGPYGDEKAKLAWAKLNSDEREQINRLFVAIGKVIASYVATLEPSYSRFDQFAERLLGNSDGESTLTESEIRGLKLFLNPAKTHCMRCHNGPYLTNFGFHNIGSGANPESGSKDFGRLFGIKSARIDEFNCLGNYSDLDAEECRDLIFAAEGHMDDGAFKVPGLRDLALTAPYFHDGRFGTLLEVLEFYRLSSNPGESGSELPPLDLSDEELRDLAAFLGSLTGSDRQAENRLSGNFTVN